MDSYFKIMSAAVADINLSSCKNLFNSGIKFSATTEMQENMENMMKAAIKTGKGDFNVTEREMPKLQNDDWALASIKVAGICGTDLRHWKKEEPELKGKIMGHELAGVVADVGRNVKNVKAGDRVVIETLLGDETCDWCRIQRYNVCPNLYEVRMKTISQAFAKYVAGPAKKFYKLPDHVSFEEAALLDTFSVCLHAIQVSGVKINDKVLVIGAGPVGLGQLQLAKLSGADVIITDQVESALEIAKDLGADEVVNIKNEDVREKVMKFTNNRGVDITYECAGGTSMPTTLPQATSCTRIGGKVIMVGGFDAGKTSIPLEWQHIQMAEIQLLPSASYSFWGIHPEMQICLDLVANGKLNAKKLITHHFSLDDINKGFETAQDKENTGAVFVALNIS